MRRWMAGAGAGIGLMAPLFFGRAQPQAETSGYTDSAACASCHPAIWQTYQRTGMARSFYRPKPENTIGDYSGKNEYYHQASDIHYAMIQRDGRYFQREYQIGFDGKQINTVDTGIDFILGSGNHSRAYLHRTRGNQLAELPLAWYSENGGYWAMNPGYDRADHAGLRRRIGYDCMFCHNGYPVMPPSRSDPRAEAEFAGNLPEGIDCQRCHGPGLKHVQLAQDRASRREDVRASIVNPGRLTPERRMDVCMQCHLETTSFPLPGYLVRYERGPFSYRPGEPLGDFRLHFDTAPAANADDKFEIAGAAYRLLKSACFRKSNGALGCTTCHNPHDVPRGEAAAAHYTAVCRQCHGDALDRLVSASKHPRSSDCVACHMPKRRTDDVVHVVMTDHYIQRRKPERDLLAPIAERPDPRSSAPREVVLYYPASLARPADELYLAVAQVIQNSNSDAGIPRLSAALERYRPENGEFYMQLGDAWRAAGQHGKALPAYEEALKREPDSVPAMQRLALCLWSLHQLERASETLKRARSLDPDDAGTWLLEGLVAVAQNRASDAIAAYQKAGELDPDLPEAFNSLGGLKFETGDTAQAEIALRNAIRLEPNYAEAHNNLGHLLSSTDRFEEARYHFEAALRIKPDYAFARYNYAGALVRAHRLEDAQSQLEAVLRADPAAADAHAFLGAVLISRGRRDDAIAHFREAVRLRPEFPRAQLDLGSALADAGDRPGAEPHLRKAAESSDAAVRAEAQKILQRLERN